MALRGKPGFNEWAALYDEGWRRRHDMIFHKDQPVLPKAPKKKDNEKQQKALMPL